MASAAVPSSSRLTLSREIVERRWVVRRGDLGCFVSGSSVCSLCAAPPFVCGPVVAGSLMLGTEGASDADVDVDVLSGAGPGPLTEDERRSVRDLVPSVDLSRASSAGAAMAVSGASSKVSYQRAIVSRELLWLACPISCPARCLSCDRRCAQDRTGTIKGGLSVHSQARNCQQQNGCSHAASAHRGRGRS